MPKSLKEVSVKDRRVLLRVDFNVSLGKDGKVDKTEDWRIRASLPTIRYLVSQKARVIILSHLGRPQGKTKKEFRLDPVARRLSRILKKPVKKLNDCLGREVEEAVENLKGGEIIFLENLRFHPGEEKNDKEFARELSSLGDLYLNDAFGVCHRKAASILAITKFLPSYAGFLLAKEIKNLKKLLHRPEHPLVVIIGGAKVASKIKVVKNFLNIADDLLFGGVMANTILHAKGTATGKSVVEADEEIEKEVKNLNLTSPKIHLPVDVMAENQDFPKSIRRAPVGKLRSNEMILDIGPDTIGLFSEIIKKSKMLIWNGPMGLFERKRFFKGTKALAELIADTESYSVVGGGDTVISLEKLGLSSRIDHISTGGGAMLDFLAGKELPGVEALKM